ncbi:MAG TPA: bacillithiol biosynthesis deacetylase BshB1 [Bacillota bacterium]|jgi:bacillithiol biosynthesis deacetylase BshB1
MARILAVGAHPDDVEIGMGGTVAAHAAAGHRVTILDLTRGERSTNGTAAERAAEAIEAAGVLGAGRDNLGLADLGFSVDEETVGALVQVIRTVRPAVVCGPYWEDRHPDHVRCSRLVTEACFAAGVGKFAPGLESFRPSLVAYYFINTEAVPSFVIDVSAYYERKLAALAAHHTQFARTSEETTGTPLNDPDFLAFVQSRDRLFGSKTGVGFAEGFVRRGLNRVGSLLELVPGAVPE